MIGLLVFGHLTLVVLSLMVAIKCLITIFSKRPNGKLLATLLFSTSLFVFLTWQHLVGFGIYKAKCALYSGFFIGQPISGVDEGYLLKDSHPLSQGINRWEPKSGKNGYVGRAVEDLITGRIGFFEVYLGNSERVHKYLLDDKGSINCVSASEVEKLAGQNAYLPDFTCLGRVELREPSARYEVQGYDRVGDGHNPKVINRESGETVSELHHYRHKTMRYVLFSNGRERSCPSSGDYPEKIITAFTFKDKFDYAYTWNSNLELPSDYFDRHGTFAPGKDKSDYGLDEAPQNICVDIASDIAKKNTNYSLHKIKVYGGKNEYSTRLDKNRPSSAMIDVFVNKTEEPVILNLMGYDPIIWNIHQEEGVNLLAVFASGHAGKAVIGPDSTTSIFIHTYAYNPGANCTKKNYHRAFSKVKGGEREFDEISDVSSGDRFVIGGAYKGAEAYQTYHDYPLENYTFKTY